jgi:hypothetical protein
MINFPVVSLPEHYTQLLAANIQNSTGTNTNLEIFINENRELNMLVKKLFTDIDKDGFLGKILLISGWIGIRNRLAAAYLEYAITGSFPDVANLSLVNDLVNLENKLRHFTSTGYSRSFMLGFYAKMSMIQLRKLENTGNTQNLSAFIIKDEHLEYMKFSKSKSIRIDWLMFQLIQFDFFLGHERMISLLKSGTRYEALFSMLLNNEQKIVIENCLRYGTSIGDKDIFLSNSIQ